MPHVRFDPDRLVSVASLFSGASFRSLSSTVGIRRFRRIAFSAVRGKVNWNRLTTSAFLSQAYRELRRSYRGEYVYGNELVRDIIARHSLTSTRIFSELRVDESWADLVVVNGTSTAYEIKTARDRLYRLPNQLQAYRRAFDRTFVVCDPTLLSGVTKVAPSDVGVLVMTSTGHLETIRDAQSRRHALEPRALFGLLREPEAGDILTKWLGGAPGVPNTLRREAWRELFCELDPASAHEAVTAALQARRPSDIIERLVSSSPAAMSLGILAGHLPVSSAIALERFMASPVAGLTRS
jgi:hypothetical protein